MFGDEPQLGVKPSSTYKFYLIGGPAGNYFTKPSVNVRVEDKSHRASAHGIGSAKTGGNYAASMAASIETEKENYDQTLWLDPTHNEYIEELSGMNFFAVINGELHTPKLTDSILHGITRASLIELARSMDIKTVERSISINELMDQIDSDICTELFASGTASVLTPISSLMYKKRVSSVKCPNGSLSMELRNTLQMIQTGRSVDSFNWQHQVNLDSLN
jgi:branched-chain amino acid aminotransferase